MKRKRKIRQKLLNVEPNLQKNLTIYNFYNDMGKLPNVRHMAWVGGLWSLAPLSTIFQLYRGGQL
jgi:hypothetical protein